jgi:hypothetical protein
MSAATRRRRHHQRGDSAMTKTSQPSRYRRGATRLARAFVALALMSGAGVVAGNAAEAAPFITVVLHPIEDGPNNDGVCRVIVGVDINMSEADARTFLAHPGQEATARLWADDFADDNDLGAVPVDFPEWPQAWAGGYSVEFTNLVGCSHFNEDPGRDEIYAQITFDDFRTGRTHRVNSSNWYGYY